MLDIIKNEDAKNILAIFAMHGFRKTSMEDIAKASGVSRQSIYKRFGSKQNCYQWAINEYLSDTYEQIFKALSNDNKSTFETLIKTFDLLTGEAIDIVKQPYGTEILDDSLQILIHSTQDWQLRLRARLADFLVRHNITSITNSNGMALSLISSSKGLLIEKPSRQQFIEDMTLIINSITNTKP